MHHISLMPKVVLVKLILDNLKMKKKKNKTKNCRKHAVIHVSMLSPRGGGGDPGQMWDI